MKKLNSVEVLVVSGGAYICDCHLEGFREGSSYRAAFNSRSACSNWCCDEIGGAGYNYNNLGSSGYRRC